MAEVSFNEVIRLRRVALRKTQEELGRLLKITKQSYGALENGKSKFSAEQLKKVCDFLGISFDELNQLPGQTKLPPISGSEYTTLVNQMIKLQREKDELQREKDELLTKLQSLQYRQQANIYTFFQSQVERMKEAYPEHYKPDWRKIAASADLPEPEKFLEHFGEYSANHSVNFLEDSGAFSAASILDRGINDALTSAPSTDRGVNNEPAPKLKSKLHK